MLRQWVHEIVAPGYELHDVGDGVVSVASSGGNGSVYDRGARVYDWVIGNALYNRLVWQASSRSYTAFAEAALASGAGPLLDVGCGTAMFTAASYRDSDRRLVLVDSSLGMLRRAARRRAGADPERVCLVRADLFDLPFVAGSFTTVSAHGLLHLFNDAERVLRVLRSQAGMGGSVYASSLVGETARARRMLRFLHRAGEAAPPRDAEQVDRVAHSVLGEVTTHRDGGMMFLHGSAAPPDSSP